MKYEFTGYNGFGKLVVTENPYEDNVDTLFVNSESGSELGYSNGDEVELEINPALIKSKESAGKAFSGKSTISTKVAGLKEVADIGQHDEVLAQIDTLAKAEYTSTDYHTYTVERQSSYMRVNNDNSSSSDGTENDLFCSIQSIYKITDVSVIFDAGKTEVYYKIFGYDEVPVKDNAFQVKDLTDGGTWSYEESKSLEDCVNTLKADYADFEEF